MSIRSCKQDIHEVDLDAEVPADTWWYYCHFKPNRDESLPRSLRILEVPYYRPVGLVEREYRGEKVEEVRTLIPGYLFVLGGREEWVKVDNLRACWHVTRILDREAFISDIRRFHDALSRPGSVSVGPSIETGYHVRVVSGPYEGVTGSVERLGNRGRLYVALRVLNRAVSVELDLCQVELIAA